VTERGFLTIGEVVRELAEEFDDLSISKIRYLEEQGIITPTRTPGGYRKFKASDLERLRLALRLQRDHFLPLHVIRERLREAEHGRPSAEIQSELPMLDEAALNLDEEGRVGVDELLGVLDVGADFVRSLESFGLITVQQSDNGRVLARDDAEIVRAAHEMTRYGLEPRHLRMYETFAERQVAFFSQILMPSLRHKNPEARNRMLATLAGLAQGADVLNRILLRRRLAHEFEDFSD
jgi:DNA-binding transcriptional MerR regulator